VKTSCVMNLNFTSEYNYGKQITQRAKVKPGIAPRSQHEAQRVAG
jgi:hypothetical protein